ncbi:MAG TPA: divergent PAP2 family protein [Vampirovibrionales bacterium]
MLLNLLKQPSIIILLSSILSCLSAQTIKILFNFIRLKKFDFGILFRTGGMPSSHSAMVTSLATSVALIDGWTNVSFALAVCFSLIVMYDASGVRRSVGIQASIINKMIRDFNTENPEQQMKNVKEIIGHTPFEVLAGALFGILVGWLNYKLLGNIQQ